MWCNVRLVCLGGFADFEGAFSGSNPTTEPAAGNLLLGGTGGGAYDMLSLSLVTDFGDFAAFQNETTPQPPRQMVPAPPASTMQPLGDFGAFQGMVSMPTQVPVNIHTCTHITHCHAVLSLSLSSSLSL